MTFSGQAGVIISQNYPKSYPMSYHCTWTIEVERFYQILLEVVDYDIGPGGSNQNCHLKVSIGILLPHEIEL